jgi:hypothetical protein
MRGHIKRHPWEVVGNVFGCLLLSVIVKVILRQLSYDVNPPAKRSEKHGEIRTNTAAGVGPIKVTNKRLPLAQMGSEGHLQNDPWQDFESSNELLDGVCAAQCRLLGTCLASSHAAGRSVTFKAVIG